ncbi:unnamed protein product [Staurois parvus]|uniref:Secreted protein n=1 Tax=Staurois parvus TaxID=386267 RepID=A0ABN9CP55_9NEOB|nr:unnamed protein product [Staurois parvus]
MGPRTRLLICCCHACNLSWAPVPASSCCCQVQSVSWVPVRPPIAAVSIATLCHCATFTGLLHTAVGFPFFHRVPVWPPIAAASTATLWLHTLVLAPLTAQMMKCAVILRSTALICMSLLTDNIISLPQQTPRAFKLKVQCSALI